MSAEILLAFVAACVLLALTPGPNMALMIANTLSNGLRAGLVTLAGTTTGLALLVASAAAGMTSVMVFMSTWFDIVRWIGAIYLLWSTLRVLFSSGGCGAEAPRPGSLRLRPRTVAGTFGGCSSVSPTRR